MIPLKIWGRWLSHPLLLVLLWRASALAATDPVSPEAPPAAASPMSFAQALQLAQTNEPSFAAAAFNMDRAAAQLEQAGRRPNPNVEVEVESLAGSGIYRNTNEAETNVRLSQTLLVGGKRTHRIRAAEARLQAARFNRQTAERDLYRKVGEAFFTLVAARERLTLARELEQIAAQLSKAAADRVAAGKVSPIEESKARVAENRARLAADRAALALRTARLSLATELGLNPEQMPPIADSPTQLPPVPPAPRSTDAVTAHPSVSQWDAVSAAGKAEIALAHAERLPDPEISLGRQYFSASDDHAFILGFSLELPIFRRNRGAKALAKANLAVAQQRRRAERNSLERQLNQSFAALKTAHAEANTLGEEIIPSAEWMLQATREGYRLGKFSYLDVLDAQRTLFETNRQYTAAREAFHKARIRYESLIGTRLDGAALFNAGIRKVNP